MRRNMHQHASTTIERIYRMNCLCYELRTAARTQVAGCRSYDSRVSTHNDDTKNESFTVAHDRHQAMSVISDRRECAYDT